MTSDDFLMVSPMTVEELLIAVGAYEDGDVAGILLTTELVADLCVRLVRLEDLIGDTDE